MKMNKPLFADTNCLNFVAPGQNLSVHSAILRKPVRQRHVADPGPLAADGLYACISVTDGDNMSVLIDFHDGRWLDPNRGAVPVGWSLQGMAPTWTPGIAAHYFETSTTRNELFGLAVPSAATTRHEIQIYG